MAAWTNDGVLLNFPYAEGSVIFAESLLKGELFSTDSSGSSGGSPAIGSSIIRGVL
jgi:hypothetical protein